MDNREFIQRCIVSSTAFTGHDGCLLIKELNEVYRKAELYDKIVESNSKSLVEMEEWEMTDTLTVDQLQELLQIQKEFDDRIPTLNLQDSKIVICGRIFEWFNTLETFKIGRRNQVKPLDVQLDELADMLAFGLSMPINEDIESILEYLKEGYFTDYMYDVEIDFGSDDIVDDFMSDIDKLYNEWFSVVVLPFAIAKHYYTIDQLIDSYKRK